MSKLSFVTEKIKKHKKLTIVIILVLVLAIGVGVMASNMNKKKEQMLAMMNQTQTSKVERRTLVSSVSATGTLTSVQSKEILVNLSGVEVKSVSVELGDMVEAGQVICEFDSSDVEENLAEAKTALNVTNQKTQMDLTTAERNLADAKEDYDTDLKRANTDLGVVYNEYVEALEDMEEAEEAWEEAKATTIEKKGELELRESQLKEAQAALSNAGSPSTYVQDFNNKKSELSGYSLTIDGSSASVEKINVDMNLDTIGIASSSGNGEENNDSGNNSNDGSASDVNDSFNAIITALKDLQSKYQTSQSAEAKVAALQQEVASWQTKYNTAKSNESNYEKSYEQAVSTSQSKLQSYDKQKRSVEDTEKSAENNIISKTDSLTTAQLNALSSGNSEEDKVEQYQQQLDDCTVEAPFSGVISAVNIEAGDTYNGSAIVTLDDISSFEVTAQIDEYDIGKIEKGQKVVIKTNATGDEELEGTVKIVSPKASGSGSEVTYTVIISVDTPSEMLRMDMTAKLSIILESKENVLTVPHEAVQEDANGNYYVEVVDASGNGSNQNTMPEGVDFENMPEMPEGMDFENMTSMNFEESGDDRPVMPSSQGDGSRPQGMKGNGNLPNKSGKDTEAVTLNTRKIYVEKGIESDYYIEIISNEITEGMEVVVPKTEAENGGNIQMMMMNRGPMGGF